LANADTLPTLALIIIIPSFANSSADFLARGRSTAATR